MVEAMAQVGGLIMLDPKASGDGGTQQQFFFAGIDGVKFRRPVVPVRPITYTAVACGCMQLTLPDVLKSTW
jgi:3-hydroxymyristoyl/3-hydroxydecanoyl-(acyl carrier protein) dehydratase